MMTEGKKFKQKRSSNLAGKLSFNIHTIKGSFNIQLPAMVVYLTSSCRGMFCKENSRSRSLI